MTELLVEPCTHEAATYAVLRWHYSHAMPAGKTVRYGVWEDQRFVGCVLFGWGASPYLGRAYGLDITECVELTRIALRDHVSPVSQIVARALAGLHRANPGVRLVVSFADPTHHHHGGIYQAGNWIYAGQSGQTEEYLWRGKWYHRRTARGDSSRIPFDRVPTRWVPGKFRYLYPLDRRMRRQIAQLAQNYPGALCSSS